MPRFSAALFVAVLAWLAPSPAAQAAPWEGVYEGTLGKAKVIVELYAGPDKSDYKGGTREASRYSYLPKARDLNLILRKEEGKELSFVETTQDPLGFAEEPDASKMTGAWVLQMDGDVVGGAWADPAGKKALPIALRRVPNEPAQGEDNVLDTTYAALWAKTVTFHPTGKAKAFGSVAVGWVKDSAFGISFPVLTGHPDAARLAAANALLMKDHLATVVMYRDCKAGVRDADAPTAADSPDIAYEVDYASPTLLGFTESGSLDCGGAHPSNYATPLTYDLVAPALIGGRGDIDLTPDGFGRILKLANKEERLAFETFALVRWRAAAAQDPEMGPECAAGWIDEQPPGEKTFSLTLRQTGIGVMRTDYPSVAAPCLFTEFNPTVIIWGALAPFVRPGQTLLPEANP